MVTSPNTKRRIRRSDFALFLCLSILLHLLAGLIFLGRPLLPQPPEASKRTPVALEERKNWLELDQKPQEKAQEPPPDATHLAEANQRVDQEAAPKGDDSRDKPEQRQTLAENKRPRQPQQPSPLQPARPASQATTPNTLPDTYAARPEPSAPEPDRLDIPLNLPELEDLTNLSPTTLARLDREQKKRVKDRPEVELEDDAIWLNLQQMDNKLLSFFRRFHDKIEAVWNYPVEASSRGIEGTLLIRIVVNKKGELLDALPLESSGSDILDYEAIQAIYRAAPFGKLPSYYPHEQLKIYAHFQYSLSRRMIYGRP